jgi:hypothetical protein
VIGREVSIKRKVREKTKGGRMKGSEKEEEREKKNE